MSGSHGIYLKSPTELAIMRKAGRMLEEVLQEVGAAAVEGVTTAELDRIAASRIKALKARAAFKGLYGFPATLCTSFNEEVVHGIPGKRKLEQGDILSIDCGLVHNGFYADSAITVAVGEISPQARQLLDVTLEALWIGIHAAKPGGRVSDIGAAIEEHVRKVGFHPTENYTGHGIGRSLHEDPKVFNTALPRGPKLSPGMTLAVEPMINIGTSDAVELKDGWTVVTRDRSLSAHFEHTIAITATGIEVLTCSNPR
jgi:methionyl aminopeptidase